ncbi:spore cortex biosynthesis protein YabQ [Solibacillus sp. FSL H8-0538]|uniref:spore cortex biosynthesis protein YabQ n=1 Tax=Solibacillus sp. FSL H8-0538 TaxID=2921400 RepID=UPI004046C597
MNAQLVSIVVMFISGMFVGAVIDFVRTMTTSYLNYTFMRRFVFIIESIVWLFLGVCTFYFMYLIKGGQWRVLDPLAQIVGIFVYEIFFQKIFRFLGRIFVNILIKPFFYMGHLFVRLVRGVIRLTIKVIKILVTPIYKIYMKFIPNYFQKR